MASGAPGGGPGVSQSTPEHHMVVGGYCLYQEEPQQDTPRFYWMLKSEIFPLPEVLAAKEKSLVFNKLTHEERHASITLNTKDGSVTPKQRLFARIEMGKS